MAPAPRTGRETVCGAHGCMEHDDREHDGDAHGGNAHGHSENDDCARGRRRRTSTIGARLRLGYRVPPLPSVGTHLAAPSMVCLTYGNLPSGTPLQSCCLLVSHDQSYLRVHPTHKYVCDTSTFECLIRTDWLS